ncbi:MULTISPECIES: LysR family transcriptional regulator [Photobacterium]|uniref:LysR family transcriptional regulator n=1 Tax=Photobacterium halotolerans TaxID=265726 RepID=A0A0F5V9U4_9GAMM|nr:MULTISPECIES: LysR family transcriptional regulator [Photobacterium]KKC98847.1 LysR family transcriptional regulator [Photobacterium halotolerans]UIP30348.1 LysR family transcriptional regulator [Photobacterium sp. TLY01]
MDESSAHYNQLERFASRLDWNLLRTYIVIVQEQSITAAADRLCLQQPTISAALKRLESTLERKLIERRPGRFELTHAGQTLYDEAMSIYRTVSRLKEFVSESQADTLGHIRIMTISHVVSDYLDELLSRFFRDHPKVTVSCEVSTTATILSELEKCTITLGVCDGVVPESLESRFLLREQYALYCGPGHALYGRKGLKLEDLRGEAYVAFTSDVLGGEHMGAVTAIRALASIGQHVRGSSCHVEEVTRMIINGVGIGVLPLHLAEPHVKRSQLWQLPPYHDLPESDIQLLFNPLSRFNDAEQALVDSLKQR